MTTPSASISRFFSKVITANTKMVRETFHPLQFSLTILQTSTKILSVGLSKMDSTRKQKTRLAIKDCALLGTPHCSPLIHSILVRSGLVFHTTHVLELISYMGVSTILSFFFFSFSNIFIYLRGRKDKVENGRDRGEEERKGKAFSFPINLS